MLRFRKQWSRLFGITSQQPRTIRRYRPALDLLEDRTVPATLFANDNWYLAPANDTDGSGGPSTGETVDNRLDHAGVPTITATFGVNAFSTVQDAVNAASSGDTVEVLMGTYTENITIANKNLALISEAGRSTTILRGISNSALGTVLVSGTTDGVQIGTPGQGFTIIGINNPSPAVESAAVYFQGTHANAQVRDNEIQAFGDHGLVIDSGTVATGFTIDGNSFTGQTFLGPNPAGNGFSAQFTLANVPRQLVVIGNGGGTIGTANVTNLTFSNNQLTGTTGGISTTDNTGAATAAHEQGNNLATIDAASSNITGNMFQGVTDRFGASLVVRRPDTTISGNTFSSTGMNFLGTEHLFIQNNTTPLGAIVAMNTFDKGAYVDTGSDVSVSITGGVGRATAGDTLHVLAGTYDEAVTINKTLTILGAQAGVDPRTGRAGPESIVTNTLGPIRVAADNVTLDGFTIEGADTSANVNPSALGAGIWTSPGASSTHGGYHIVNNIIQNNIIGLYLNNDGTIQTVVQHNLFQNNNLPGSAGGNAIYSDLGLDNALIDANKFTGDADRAFLGFTVTNTTISNNDIDGKGIGVGTGSNLTITGNTITGGGSTGVSFVSVTGATISGNDITGKTSAAVNLVDSTDIGVDTNTLDTNIVGINLDNSSATVTNNAISGGTTGVLVTDGASITNLAGNNFDSSADNSTDLRLDADAGTVTVGAGNKFAGDTYFIDNRSPQSLNVIGSTFDETNNFRIEDKMFHAPDSSTSGLITWVANQVFVTTPGTGQNDETIQNAANGAVAGDTVNVEAGTFAEHVTVTKSLTFLGANAGIDARTGVATRNTESIVDGTLTDAAFIVNASNVTIDGFTIEHGANGGFQSGIWLSNATSGNKIVNDIITANSIGVFAESAGPLLIQHNSFNGNNETGAAGGTGIYTEVSNGLTVDANEFINHTINNPVIFAASGAGSHVNLAFTNNALNNNFGVYGLGIAGGLFQGNTITTTDAGGATGLSIAGGSSNITILNNDLSNNQRGLRVDDEFSFGSNSNVVVNFNKFANNSEYALGVLAGGYSGTFDASANYWGTDNATTAFVQSKINSTVPVDFTPWIAKGTDTSGDPGYQPDLSALIVDDNSAQAGATGRIQEAVNDLTAGGTINVMAGSYNESVTIAKAATLLGAQAGINPSLRTNFAAESTVTPPSGQNAFSIGAAGVTIKGFTVSGAAGGAQGVGETTPVAGTDVEQNFISGFSGIGVAIAAGSTNTRVAENDISANYAGVYLSTGATGAVIQANNIHGHTGSGLDAGSAIVFEGNNPNVLVTQNFLTGNTNGLYIWTGFGNNLTGTHVVGNSFSGNTAKNVNNTNSELLDASGNWWGTTDATAIAASISGNVDFSPFLLSGTDTDSATPGFQGNFGSLAVTTLGAEAGATGRIQEAINLTPAGGTITIGAGGYAEHVTINKSLTLQGDTGDSQAGPGANAPTLDGTTFGAGAVGVQIATGTSNVTVRGLNLVNWAGNGILAAGSTNVLVEENQFQNIGGSAILANGPALNTGWTVRNNVLTNFGGYGIQIDYAQGTILVEKNVLSVSNASPAPSAGTLILNRSATSPTIIVHQNSYTGNLMNAIYLNAAGGPITGGDIENNTINVSGRGVWVNAFGGAITGTVVRNNSILVGTAAIVNQGTDTVNAALNWWGTNVASQIKPRLQGSVDYSPFLDSGTDTDAVTPGFQGSFNVLDVTSDSAQVGSQGGVVEGALAVNNTGTVKVMPGTYTEAFTVARNITLQLGTAATVTPSALLSGQVGLGGAFVLDSTGSKLSLDPAGPSQLTVRGNLLLASTGTLALRLNSVSAIDRVVAVGDITLATGTQLSVTRNFTVPSGSHLSIVQSTGSNPTVGTFAGLPENALLTLGGQQFHIHYNVGTGNNDIELVAV